MPLPHHASSTANRIRRSRLSRWWRRRREWAEVRVQPATPKVADEGNRVDAHTRTFWSQGAEHSATLVETSGDAPGPHPRSGRAAALVRAHESGRATHSGGRPPGNPAFTEALFVELMRARQYGRAYAQLSVDCQLSWGSAEAFAAAQGAGAMRRLLGVKVKDVRFLQEWRDTARGTTYREVAELDVEYTLAGGGPRSVLPRVVHLVADRGRWRSICYPM